MAEPLKNLYNRQFFESFFTILRQVLLDIERESFLHQIFCDKWEALELKERMYHITHVLHNHLPTDFEEAAAMLVQIVGLAKKSEDDMSLEYIFLADYIEQFGIDHFEVSVKAMEKITQFASFEFAVRPFILKYEDKMMDQMAAWSQHSNYTVRRFSSEGCRPRLPWAIALPQFKDDPSLILPILERLKNDPSEFVRRSVANNLNDISKDHPDLVISIANRWKGKTKNTDAVLKHACRTLLKQGNTKALKLFGFGNIDDIKISPLHLSSEKVKTGEDLEFSFELSNNSKKSQFVRLEYGLYFLKSKGTHNRKVFQISEKAYQGGSSTKIVKRQSFRPVTTRKLYPGKHYISIIANGVELDKKEFWLFE